MPTVDEDLLARIDTQILWQPYVMRVNTMLNAAAARGARYVATCGWRSYAQQDALYAIGRTIGKIGRYVTHARGGQSAHQFYCAIDFALDGSAAPGLQPDYEDSHYVILAEEAVKAGLEAGFYWPGKTQDTPHVMSPVKKWGITWADLDTAFRNGGRLAVISVLENHAPKDWW